MLRTRVSKEPKLIDVSVVEFGQSAWYALSNLYYPAVYISQVENTTVLSDLSNIGQE